MDNTILHKIQKLCANENITITELERRLGFSVSSIRKWDKGDPSLGKAVAIADYFNVSLDYLAGRSKVKSTVENVLSDKEMIKIQRLRTNLSKRDNQKMIDMMKIQFAEDFPDEDL